MKASVSVQQHSETHHVKEGQHPGTLLFADVPRCFAQEFC